MKTPISLFVAAVSLVAAPAAAGEYRAECEQLYQAGKPAFESTVKGNEHLGPIEIAACGGQSYTA